MESGIIGLAIIGSSGFAREILDLAHAMGVRNFKFLDIKNFNTCCMGFDVIEDSKTNVQSLIDSNWEFAVGVGEPKLREKIALNHPQCKFPNLLHPSATFGFNTAQNLKKDSGIIITAGCRLTNSITIGDHVHVNLNSTVGHDCLLDDYASVMPGVNVSGNVHLSKKTYIGTGASIINGANDKFLKIGQNSIIGAGSVVTRDIPADVVAVGTPAKPLPSKIKPPVTK